MTAINSTTAYIHGHTESRMTDAEAVYTAQEAADKLADFLKRTHDVLDGINDVPFSEASNHLDTATDLARKSLTALAEVKSALSKIKVRETADATVA